jgi:hypothetical protein
MLLSSIAHADDRATGFRECRELEARNDKELAMWTAAQPPKPYAYAERETVLDAPWVELGRAVGHSAGLLVTTLVPHVGVAFRSSLPEFLITWPLSVSVGPALSCSRKGGSFDVDHARPNRFLLEPSLFVGDQGTTFSLRPGYRFLHHPADWILGFGAGVGLPIEIVRPRGASARLGLGPEAVAQLGACCAPGYATLTARLDFFFDGPAPPLAATPVMFSVSLGLTYF